MITVRFCGNWIPDWDFKEYQHKKKLLMRYHRKAFDTVRDAYRAVFSDVCVFPIAGFSLADFSFEDSWGEQREYGGTRSHEGTDLFGKSTLPGFYPLLSVCDGTVDKIGWLPLGGYRIGIRGSSGGYYYYAHLDSYAQDFQIGQPGSRWGDAWINGKFRLWSGRDKRKIPGTFTFWYLYNCEQ